MENVIGRTEEKALIKRIGNSGEPELLAVYGRRRTGKTFLTSLHDNIDNLE